MSSECFVGENRREMTAADGNNETNEKDLPQATYNRPGFLSGCIQRSPFVPIRVHSWLSFSDCYSHLSEVKCLI
jgi:hypothetical protein